MSSEYVSSAQRGGAVAACELELTSWRKRELVSAARRREAGKETSEHSKRRLGGGCWRGRQLGVRFDRDGGRGREELASEKVTEQRLHRGWLSTGVTARAEGHGARLPYSDATTRPTSRTTRVIGDTVNFQLLLARGSTLQRLASPSHLLHCSNPHPSHSPRAARCRAAGR